MKKVKVNILISCLATLILVAVSFSLTFAAEGGIENVKATPGTRNVKLTWNAYEGAHHYGVYYAGKEKKATGKSYNVTGLNVDTPYGFRIKAYDSKNNLIATSYVIKTTTLGVKNVAKFKANAGYKSITVTFNKTPHASYYELYRSKYKNKGFKKIATLTAKKNTDSKYNKNQIFFKDTGKGLENNKIVRNTPYYYRVRAVRNQNGKKMVSPKYSTASARAVRQMYQEIKVHGNWYIANGYSGGTFYTTDGHSFGWESVSRAYCDYSRYSNYTNRSAENFVNELMAKGKFSRSGYKRMIWISTYTQHLYIFKWTKNGWRIEKQWECSTGGAGSPTPMGFDKDIDHKHKIRNGTYYWNCFSSHNAMHGKQSGWEDIDGQPHSHGCVRNYNSNAEWIYDNCKYGTPVVCW